MKRRKTKPTPQNNQDIRNFIAELRRRIDALDITHPLYSYRLQHLRDRESDCFEVLKMRSERTQKTKP
jgi:hypothetical protein